MSSDPGFRKFWLLHSIEEPSVDGTEFTVARTMDGDSGMLKNTVLLPEKDNVSITAVGGPGKEFWVFGTNYPNAATSRPDPANERGEWRVEVVPVNPSAEDCFLNVIQVADNSCRSFNDVRRIDGDKVAGAMISDRVVIFGRDGQALDQRAGFEIPDSEKVFRILVTDLVPGVWKVMKDGKVLIPAAEVCADDGTLYFSGQSGRYTLSMK